MLLIMGLSDENLCFIGHFLDFLNESFNFDEIILYLFYALRLFNGVFVIIPIAPLIHLMLKL